MKELKSQSIGVRLDEETRKRLEVLAEADERSLSYIARKCVEMGLPVLEKEILNSKSEGETKARRTA